ncbi:NADH-quinone oxidoreductase subunit NuoE [Clostridium thermarum]|uniref:NADH-quinone oxidoreductase subunit NuoE n=1 Tax=Clostridium thermarum TaxID=1716543 RepID=UPI001123D970|nr:NADH-quinone oxidoreductase subunit NuoE [Clostridium thermarum]
MCNNSKFKELDEFIHQQENKESALIAVLHKAQELFGYLGEEVQNYVAEKLSIPVSKVYGVISFYSYFTTEPKGKYVISICTGTACFVKGSGEIVEEFKRKLNIKEGETTKDGLYTIDTLRCVGACGLAPVIMVNNRVYGHFTKKDINKVLEEYK